MNEMNPELRFLIGWSLIVFPIWWIIALALSDKSRSYATWIGGGTLLGIATMLVIYGIHMLLP